MLRIAMLTFAALTLAACGGAPDEASTPTAPMENGEMEHGGMDHAAMGHGNAADAPLEALADDGVMPVVEIDGAWMRAHPGGRDITAAYFRAELSEGSADRLLAARIDGADRVELHGHTMGEDGLMSMHEIAPPMLMAGEQLVFQPRGQHLMVFGLATVVEGDSVTGELEFERAGIVEIVFDVRNSAPEASEGG